MACNLPLLGVDERHLHAQNGFVTLFLVFVDDDDVDDGDEGDEDDRVAQLLCTT
jgi:hypothetical protein